jgi:hypothetical protein
MVDGKSRKGGAKRMVRDQNVDQQGTARALRRIRGTDNGFT